MDKNLQYWDERWKSASNPYDGSWDDQFARLLELRFIERRWPNPRSVLELGCGPYTLDEWPPLKTLVGCVDYLGLDGSPTAIMQANCGRPVPGPRKAFELRDLNSPDRLPKAEMVLSRRCLQNLDPAVRYRVIDQLCQFKSGILLENTVKGFETLNSVRAGHNLPELKQAAFNHYLTDEEVSSIKTQIPHMRMFWPLSGYYYLSRGKRDTRNDPYAFAMALETAGSQGIIGPLTAFVWSDL